MLEKVLLVITFVSLIKIELVAICVILEVSSQYIEVEAPRLALFVSIITLTSITILVSIIVAKIIVIIHILLD